jgi:Ca2+-binding EF-hand superfamily protein
MRLDYNSKDVSHMMYIIDLDNDGFISKAEFIKALNLPKKPRR